MSFKPLKSFYKLRLD